MLPLSASLVVGVGAGLAVAVLRTEAGVLTVEAEVKVARGRMTGGGLGMIGRDRTLERIGVGREGTREDGAIVGSEGGKDVSIMLGRDGDGTIVGKDETRGDIRVVGSDGRIVGSVV